MGSRRRDRQVAATARQASRTVGREEDHVGETGHLFCPVSAVSRQQETGSDHGQRRDDDDGNEPEGLRPQIGLGQPHRDARP